MKVKLSHAFYEDPIGTAGGLALWWNEDASVNILKSKKQQFWEMMSRLRDNNNDKWCILGDSNVVASPNNKSGGSPFDPTQARVFFEFFEDAGLLDLPIKDGSYTWSNLRIEEDSILEKLDRIVVSVEWNSDFLKAIGVMDAPIASDHSPIILFLNGIKKKGKRAFKFESKWLLEEECSRKISESWESTPRCPSSQVFGRKLKQTKVKLMKWSKEVYGKGKRNIEKIMLS
ncbi:hypothetical protein V6N11_010071 [Hibiscus sabdariffa]|uniref:Endonuclease/exonuclease/phosphatase domain-containing protein n=1 Tax=Hibiscus sabdariffa TaxID=183260 RepID=A0ABR2PDM3_9ROSI